MTGGRPTDDLVWAYRGTAAFLRAVSRLSNAQLFEQREGVLPARLIAEVSYRARGYARLAEEIRLGVATPVASEGDEYADAVALGTTLPGRALRHLVEHSSIHLRVEWRDLPDELWEHQGRDIDAALVTPRQAVRARTRQVWEAAANLSEAQLRIPDEVRSRLEAADRGTAQWPV